MEPAFNTVALVGVGLLGGSLGLALKQRGLAKTIRGVGRRQSSIDAALEHNVIDEGYLTLDKAVMGADLVVICTPANAVPAMLDTLRPLCARETVVTDVASTKSQICSHMRKAWAAPYRFIGCHPMAGSEKYGPENADPDLYDSAVVFMEKEDDHADDAYKKVMQLWTSIGAKVITIDPEIHDQWVARTSHIPHIAASALAQLVDNPEEALPFIGNGFRDATRIAEGRPEIWRDICLTNPEAVGTGLRKLIADLESMAESVESQDGEGLENFFDRGVQARRSILDS
jgi:prephenate dehydrogenase